MGNCQIKFELLHIKLENGTPFHDTISRLFERLNPVTFQKAFLGWVACLKQLFEETIIPIDGQTLRGSHQASKTFERCM